MLKLTFDGIIKILGLELLRMLWNRLTLGLDFRLFIGWTVLNRQKQADNVVFVEFRFWIDNGPLMRLNEHEFIVFQI